MNIYDPNCEGNRSDCFAFCDGKCAVLNDTRFGRPCPFYKTKKQCEKEEKNRQERLMQHCGALD